MCIIVDANVAHEFGKPFTHEALAIRDWLMEDGGTIVSGGKLKKELLQTSFKSVYLTLLQAGRLYQYESSGI